MDNYSRDWFSLLSSSDTRLNKLGKALFKYATYFGFGFSPESFMRMASVSTRKSIPDYVETIKNIDNFKDPSKSSIFVYQYLLNHTNDDNLVPNIEVSNIRKTSDNIITFNSDDTVFNKIFIREMVKDDIRYQVVRPVIKVTVNGETKVYSTSKPVVPFGEDFQYFETIPLGYKGKVFEYQYEGLPTSVINKTSIVDNSEINSSEEDDWGDNGFVDAGEVNFANKDNNIKPQDTPTNLGTVECVAVKDAEGRLACVTF